MLDEKQKIMKKPLIATYVLDAGLNEMTKEDALKLDILNVGFGRPKNGLLDVSELPSFAKVKDIKEMNPKLNILLSMSCHETETFGVATETSEKNKAFADSIVKFAIDNDLDGIDIDWEYPTGDAEKAAHTEFLRNLREGLDADTKKKRLLTIAAGTKTWYFEITDVTNSVQYLDYVNIMTYDMNCGSSYALHHSCTYPMKTDLADAKEGSCQENIKVFMDNGVPAEKIIIGAAFYGRRRLKVESDTDGLFGFTPVPGDYAPAYKELIENYENKNGYTKYWDDNAKGPYLFDGENFISYDDAKAIEYKCQLVQESGIAGIMSWFYSLDNDGELLDIMYNKLKK